MTKDTQQLFDAPWQKSFQDWESYKEIMIYDSKNQPVCLTRNKEMSNRLARLPELYDALLHCICSSCNVCIYDHCGSPVDCEQLLSKDCTYEDSKLCFEHEARELLRKVRDGE
jgi:hypothetical protein